MTVSSTSSRVVYIGNGSTTVFPFAFKVMQAADLAVVYSDASGSDVTLSPSQFAASGFGLDAGGSVTYPLSGPPIGSGTRLTLYRTVAVTQPTALGNQGAMWPQVIEAALDRLTFIAQNVADQVSRALVTAPTDSGTPGLLPNATMRANSVLAFDGAGQLFAATLDAGVVSWSSWIINNFRTVASAAAGRTALAAVGIAGDTLTGALNEAHGADIASAGTINLATATGNVVDVTGTTTVTAITLADGAERTVRFTGALTLTNGASLVLPGGTNITTAAGDFAIFRGYAAGVVRCVGYTRASGAGVKGVQQIVSTITGAVATGTTGIPDDDTIPQNTEGDQYMSLAITPKSATSKLLIEVTFNYGHSTSDIVIVALFQDTTANALAVAGNWASIANINQVLGFSHVMTSGTVSPTTFKVRAGPNTGGTVTFNGLVGTRKFGGVYASSIIITEIA